MVLFFSDIHFGRSGADAERANEAALIACLQAHAEAVAHLYLLGDVFDEYIEYPTLIPKGYVRFQALLAAWTDRGVPVTYLVGNHDPWHRDYFEKELGVTVRFHPFTELLYGMNVYMAHGDGLGPQRSLYKGFKPVLRHPIPVALYRTIFPGDTGFRLARWVKRNFGREHIVAETVTGLRTHARACLADAGVDAVVMGHSHVAEGHRWPEGSYVNTGYWHDDRTFAQLDADGLRLRHWNGSCSLDGVPPRRPS